MNEDQERTPQEPEILNQSPIYGIKVDDLTQERLDVIAGIYKDTVYPEADTESLKRTLNAHEITRQLKDNKYESLEFRLGSSENPRAKLWVSGRHTLVDDSVVVDFEYDPNPPSGEDTVQNDVAKEFKSAVYRYYADEGVAVLTPEQLEESQDSENRLRMRVEYLKRKNTQS